jgi:putative GTP pyrophosphokinase
VAKKSRKNLSTGTGEGPSEAIRASTPDHVWQNNPEMIRRFLDMRVDHGTLCAEIEYILRTRITEKDIKTAAIVSRAKTLDSFLEKLGRKKYEDPFAEITDFAGARVVCLYRSDLDRVHEVIKDEFDVLEEIDKARDLAVDQFGYGARHYIVRLGKSSSGARYDSLKNLSCEIQVRTVVQDAWAIIQHHMVYKRESQVPKPVLRKLNSLAALFETVDDQFDSLRGERESYVAEVRDSARTAAFLENELNLDSFREYLKWSQLGKPFKPLENWDGQLRLVLDALLEHKYKKLRDVDSLVKEMRAKIDALKPLLQMNTEESAGLDVALALALKLPKDVEPVAFGPEWYQIINNHRS